MKLKRAIYHKVGDKTVLIQADEECPKDALDTAKKHGWVEVPETKSTAKKTEK